MKNSGINQKWLNCRLDDIQARLEQPGQGVSRPVISRLLQAQGYRLRVNVKELTGPSHPDREPQFQPLREQRGPHLAVGQPLISVDTKKKAGSMI
jgi:hypothetical protein